jgi:hypothetical protein
MERRTKKALLSSLLVCPGTGHWILGQRGRGAALIGLTLAVVIWFMVRFIGLMLSFYDEILNGFMASGELLPPMDRISELHTSVYVQNWWLLLVILGLWVYSAWDIYPRKRG